MANELKELRAAVVAALKDNIPEVGPRVFNSRSLRIADPKEDLPQILIYTQDVNISEHSSAPRRYKWAVELVITVVGRDPDSGDLDPLQDTMDDLLDAVLALVEQDPEFDCGSAGSILEDIRYSEKIEGEQLLGAYRIQYEALLFTATAAMVDDYLRTHMEVDNQESSLQTDVESDFDQPQ